MTLLDNSKFLQIQILNILDNILLILLSVEQLYFFNLDKILHVEGACVFKILKWSKANDTSEFNIW